MAQSAGKMALRAPAVRLPAPAPVAARQPQGPQAAGMRVSSPHDPAEREAVAVARRVVQLPEPRHTGAAGTASASPGQALRSPWVARLATHIVQRQAAPAATAPAMSAATASAIAGARGGGQPLPPSVRRFMEPRFGADFSRVRVHTDGRAATLSQRLQAQAFTVGQDVFFGRGRFQPESAEGRELIAHELTHTVQQGGAVQRSPEAPAAPVPVPVQGRSAPQAQRLGIGDALDYFAEQAHHIPGFRMFTIVLGINPVNMRSVARSPANILRAVVEFLPGGHLITQALDNHGIVDRIAAWVAQQFETLGMVGASIRGAIDAFLDSLSWTDIFDLGGVWRRAVRLISEPIDRLIAFAGSLVSGIIDFIKQAILRPIAGLAQGTRAYPLLCAVLGSDPVTGDPVAQTPSALLGGFMTLIGQQEVWQNIQRGNAVARCFAFFQGALDELMGFVRQIPGLFIAAFCSLELADIVLVPRAFLRIGNVFAGFAGRFVSWGLGKVLGLLEIIFSVVAPGAMAHLRRAGGAIQTIFRDPIGFIGNLVRAARAGFSRFAGGFLGHLRNGLLTWLTGELPGIHIPAALSMPEILKFVLSVLGLSWGNVRAKLVTAVGDTAVRAMETGFDLVRTLVTEGPAAAWAQVRESLGNLQQMAIDGLIDLVRNLIVTRAVPRLVAMFIPGAGFIGAIMAIWGTIQTFIAQVSRIVQVVTGFLNSMAAIASGNIAAAATRVEGILANLLSLAISFLFGFAGLGRVADRVRALIERIRTPIDRALDRVVAWIVGAARRLGRFVAQAGVPNDPNERLRLASRASVALAARLPRTGLTAPVIARAHDAIKFRYGLAELTPYQQAGAWHVRAVINPPLTWRLPLPGETAGTGGIHAVATQTGPGGELTAGVQGELRGGTRRRGMESALPGASDLPGIAFSYLRGYRRAHLYGPGFGDETAIGLMYASEQVNNELQSRGSKYGIEGYARQIRDRVVALNGRVAVQAVATSFRDPPPGVPQPLNQPVLRIVTYTFVVVDRNGDEIRYSGPRATATITCAPPQPNGAGGQGSVEIRGLVALDAYIGSRSARTGL